MAGLWSARQYGVLRRAPVVWPCARPCALLRPRGERFHEDAWVGPLYWIRWAGGHRRLHPRGRRIGPGGELRLPDWRSPALRTACTERVRAWPSSIDLACYRRFLGRSIRRLTTSLEGARGAFGERIGGAFESLFVGVSFVTALAAAPAAPPRLPSAAVHRPAAGTSTRLRHCLSDGPSTAPRHPPHGRSGACTGSAGAHSGGRKQSHRPSSVPASWQHGAQFVRCTGCGGGDAVVGGVEQYRRQSL